MTASIRLEKTCSAWDQAELQQVFNEELRSLPVNALPLQQGLRHSSMALDHALSASILSTRQDGEHYIIHAGLFYTGIIAGCNCADDPTPQDEVNEYCEALFTIDSRTGITSVALAEQASEA